MDEEDETPGSEEEELPPKETRGERFRLAIPYTFPSCTEIEKMEKDTDLHGLNRVCGCFGS
jgi:hypothetical protein